MKRTCYLQLIALLSIGTCVAQPHPDTCYGLPGTVLSANRISVSDIDLMSNTPSMIRPLLPSPSKKSPLLAGTLSLLIPGAGDVYAENYLMAGFFLAGEATGWYFVLRNNAQGDDATSAFEGYADEHWRVDMYAEWLNRNAKNFPGGENAKPITINPDERLRPWERVNWEELNTVELLIPVFSHRLPAHGEQQYYELIGKYDQYSYGWDDKHANGLDTWQDYRDISPRFRSYAKMRGDANSFYNTAGTFANLIVLNHILAAANAFWSASRFNKHVELESRVFMRIQPSGHAELIPAASVRIRLFQ